ncbi:MAG TPA: [FeFe] hydrogenase, group A [Candidatus Pacearchaeota archaeon]|nr:[FeFe] hydrogenase, group A [Candidatus Parcubacteria bacterium]HOU45668.1 [FeFe] hydrogenase, group A [Candidatus Pacearchaeota archaeon]HPM08270.1 [FeFe] hydrogenase, group A [Candidatus Pacearchaeota archaeon]HQI74597.1 [FeFe] hydrogenase, group A [Candidatus Pacearchaeota archaeon]
MIEDKKIIHIKIDEVQCSGFLGQSVLEIARANDVTIPALCFHPDLPVKANCRLCLVQVKGKEGMFTSCSLKAEDKMEIVSRSAEIDRARKINLELIFAEHREECDDCNYSAKCPLLKLAVEYKINTKRFKDRKEKMGGYEFGPAIYFDSSKCIDCLNCVDMCAKQGVNFYELKKTGHHHFVTPTSDKKRDCIYCGQCITHCPVGAIEAVGEYENAKIPFEKKKEGKVIIAQIAPSVRTSIGEDFSMPYGSIVTEQLIGALKVLGADKVFDVSLGSDLTTVEEAKELVERIKEKRDLPMFTSCCPGWVRFLELYYPDFIPNLTTVRSPHIILGGLVKTYWAEKEKIDPKNIIVVSIMPCTAKKYEITRKELEIDGIAPVDYVLTVRELSYLLKKNNIDFKNVPASMPDNPLGEYSGAGVIFGASGGVMESALRTACNMMTSNNCPVIDFRKVRGEQEVKIADVIFKGKTLKVAVVNSTGNMHKIMQDLKDNPKAYDYIEVMACPGGCIGGGGQPVPVNEEIRRKRASSLYKIDEFSKTRTADQNPLVIELYKGFLSNQENIHKIFHTNYSKKEKEQIKNIDQKE